MSSIYPHYTTRVPDVLVLYEFYEWCTLYFHNDVLLKVQLNNNILIIKIIIIIEHLPTIFRFVSKIGMQRMDLVLKSLSTSAFKKEK